MKKYLALLLCSFHLSNSMDSPAHPELHLAGQSDTPTTPAAEAARNEEDPILVQFPLKKKSKSPARQTVPNLHDDVSLETLQFLITQGNPQERKIAGAQFEILCINMEVHALKTRLHSILAARAEKEEFLQELLLESKRSHSAPPALSSKKS